jgi:hypothetical protein
VDHRILHALPSYITPGQCGIEGGIVTARGGQRANGKNPLTMTTTISALLRPQHMTRPVLDYSLRTGPELSRVGSATSRVVAVLAELKRCSFARRSQAAVSERWAEFCGQLTYPALAMVEAPIAAFSPFFRKRRRELLTHSSFLHSLYPSSTCDRMSELRGLGTYRLASPLLLSPTPERGAACISGVEVEPL